MTVQIVVQPEAAEQTRAIDAWWRENRPKSPELFFDELGAAFALLAQAPEAGPRYQSTEIPGLRRVMLRRTRYHLYYVYDAAAERVTVLAVWSALKGRTPF